MFRGKMPTTATPERVYALCKLVEKKPLPIDDLKQLMEPDCISSNKGEKYYNGYYQAATELELIDISDDIVSLKVDQCAVSNIDSMRKHANFMLRRFQEGDFYRVTRAFFSLGKKTLELGHINDLARVIEKKVEGIDDVAMRAWRFWASFLGFGILHDMQVLPNAAGFISDAVASSGIEPGRVYTMSEFIGRVEDRLEITALDIAERSFNYGLSCGLRTLHDIGSIKLEHILDQEDIWTLDPLPGHPLDCTVTNITINR